MAFFDENNRKLVHAKLRCQRFPKALGSDLGWFQDGPTAVVAGFPLIEMQTCDRFTFEEISCTSTIFDILLVLIPSTPFKMKIDGDINRPRKPCAMKHIDLEEDLPHLETSRRSRSSKSVSCSLHGSPNLH